MKGENGGLTPHGDQSGHAYIPVQGLNRAGQDASFAVMKAVERIRNRCYLEGWVSPSMTVLRPTLASATLLMVTVAKVQMCSPVFTPIEYNRSFPHSYVDEGLASLPSLAPNYRLLVQRPESQIGDVLYSLLAYQKDAGIEIVTIEGVALLSGSPPKTWKFTAACASSVAPDGLVTTLEQVAALPRRESAASGNNPPTRPSPLFPSIPPIAAADPSLRRPLEVLVPTGLAAERHQDTFSVSIDRGSMESVGLSVGDHMFTGIESQQYVYSEGSPRPGRSTAMGLKAGLDFDLGTRTDSSKLDGVPTPGQRYVVEVKLSIFETDVPSQHLWEPKDQNYRTLWTRTIRQVVE